MPEPTKTVESQYLSIITIMEPSKDVYTRFVYETVKTITANVQETAPTDGNQSEGKRKSNIAIEKPRTDERLKNDITSSDYELRNVFQGNEKVISCPVGQIRQNNECLEKTSSSNPEES
jgi:hypothetical protein